MALRTKCLECECYTERKEDYQDISMPIKKKKKTAESDDEDDEPQEGN